MPLMIEIEEKSKGVAVVSLTGSLDSNTYTDLLKRLEPIWVKTIEVLILDMEGVEYVSSLGISAVLKAKKAIEEKKGTFIMVNLQPQIQTVFDIVKALPSMRVFKSLEEADNYLAAMQRRVKIREKKE